MDSDKSTVSTVLPEAFLDRMKDMLGDDYQAFLQAYDQPRTYGLRVNTAKISCEEFEKIVPFEVKKSPGFQTDIFTVKIPARPAVPFIRQDFITFRSQVP